MASLGFGTFGYGLFLKNRHLKDIEEDLRLLRSVQRELEKEAQQSSGKFWFGKEEDTEVTPPG